MGCDGGTIPRRDELVKTKKKPEQKDKDCDLIFQWRCCAITQEPLQTPIVTCGLGKLYNKVSILEALLNKSKIPEIKHIKSLKDVKELNLTSNPTYKAEEIKDGGSTMGPSPFICPVIGLEMTGRFRFVAIWSCGCVISERALKQIDTDVCHKCQNRFRPSDVIILNGNEDDLILMKDRLVERQTEQKKIKAKLGEAVTEKITKSVTKRGNTTTLILPKPKRRPGNLLVTSEKMKSEYSVTKDPQASDVYKALFTSHKSEKEQNRAHWITYNPFYN